MELEHLRLQKQWEDFSAEGNRTKARKFLLRFQGNLLHHIQLEDGALSPTFNKYLKIERGTGPSGTMSSDHDDVVKLFGKVMAAFDADDPEKLSYAKNHFERALIKHHRREEETHYVFFDKVIEEKEWNNILKGEV